MASSPSSYPAEIATREKIRRPGGRLSAMLLASLGTLRGHLLGRRGAPRAGHRPARLWRHRRFGGAFTGSARSAFGMEKHSPIMINTNGAADAMATDCRAVMAASTEPWIAPASRQIAAAAPVKAPHTTTFHALGYKLPFEESMPITTDATSALLMKNSATKMTASAP
jgi:hypothetical protein